jgi:hypothetical protein
MKISLHLIPLQRTIDATSVGDNAATHTRTLCEFPTGVTTHFAEDVSDMCVCFLLCETVCFFVGEGLVFVDAGAGFVVAFLHPEEPVCVVAFEEVAG